ncbi:acyltransferase domain-containing protein [Pendulispora brunnea]|uniref:Acyltransferase domain-containing protein n=1 Tax=Pendulispora brunnea TaxID=2905690 RepID=A0ABZ2KNY6_9BACT
MTEAHELGDADRVLTTLRKLRTRVDALREPIAVIGLRMRLPPEDGSSERFWSMLVDAREAPRTIPRGRWQGEATSHVASLLDDVERFDAAFFGMTAAEACVMDPRQRMLLEVAWEALEVAGLPMAQLGRCGVYVGVTSPGEFFPTPSSAPASSAPFITTGKMVGAAAGRISHFLGATSPSLVIDTACSASLVAVHLAMTDLRARSCDVALCGGVNVIFSSEFLTEIEGAGIPAADDRCRPFDATASGVGLGEGCGFVVLKRLSDAVKDGDVVWAILRGSAVNHNGASDGLSAPNPDAQELVIREALRAARTAPRHVQYVEAHGTATTLGDPIEVEALSRVFADRCQPLRIGSVKSNIGHLLGAAGIASLIKTILAIRHRKLPPSLHFETPNPHIPWEHIPIRVQAELSDWPNPGEPLIAGVSAFGQSGTNAHVVVSEPPPETTAEPGKPEAANPPERVLVLSAKTPKALRNAARAVSEWLGMGPTPPATEDDIGYTAALRRTHHDHRLAVLGRDAGEWRDVLAAYAGGRTSAGAISGVVNGGRSPRIVFVFPGQGGQWAGMGRELLRHDPVFRHELEACDAAIRRHAPFSVKSELETMSASRLDDLEVLQPVLFAVMSSLAAVWRSWGIEPDAVVGHSLGEVAAAYVAGRLALDDGARIICLRSRLLKGGATGGAMLLLELGRRDTTQAIASFGDRVTIAASNGPRSTVVAGDTATISELKGLLERNGVSSRPIKNVQGASHSRFVDALRAPLLDGLSGISPRPGTVKFWSTAVKEQPASLDNAYWWKNLRQPVRFAERIEELAKGGYDVFVEVSPHPVLIGPMTEIFQELEASAVAVGTLRREKPEQATLLAALGSVHCAGGAVNWKKLYPAHRRVCTLPTYSWEQTRYWPTAHQTGERATQALAVARSVRYPFVATQLAISPGDTHVAQASVDLRDTSFAYLRDHTIHESARFPMSGFLEMVIEAVHTLLGARRFVIEDMDLTGPTLTLGDDGATTLQITLRQESRGYRFEVASRVRHGPWVPHTTGHIAPDNEKPPRKLDLAALREGCSSTVDGEQIYERLADRHAHFGPRFKALDSLAGGLDFILGRFVSERALSLNVGQHYAHPALVEAAFHSFAALADSRAPDTLPRPVRLGRVRVTGHRHEAAWVQTSRPEDGSTDFEACLKIVSADGDVLLDFERAQMRPVDPKSAVFDAGEEKDGIEFGLVTLGWQREPTRSRIPTGRSECWLVVAEGQLGELVRAKLPRTYRVVTAKSGKSLARISENSYEVDRGEFEQVRALLKEAFGSTGPDRVIFVRDLAAEGEAIPRLEPAMRDARHIQRLVQSVVRTGWANTPRLYLVARSNQPVAEDVTRPEDALVWGIGVILHRQLPELACTVVDWGLTETLDALVDELRAHEPVHRVALRQGQRWVPRAMPLRLNRRSSGIRLDPIDRARLDIASVDRALLLPSRDAHLLSDRTYLVAAALGGAELARRLAARGARHVVVLVPRGRAEQISAPVLQGVDVRVVELAADDRDELHDALVELSRQIPPLAGIVHATTAGTDTGIVDRDDVLRDMKPSLRAVWNLHELTLEQPLEFFTTLFLTSDVFGAPNQADFGAMMAFLNAFTHYRIARGLPAQSVACEAWRLEDLSPMPDSSAAPLELLQLALGSSVPLLLSESFAELWMDAQRVDGTTNFASQLRRVQGDDRAQLVLRTLLEILSSITGTPMGDISSDAPLQSVLDSLGVIGLRQAVEQTFDLKVSVVSLFAQPTIRSFAMWCTERLCT